MFVLKVNIQKVYIAQMVISIALVSRGRLRPNIISLTLLHAWIQRRVDSAGQGNPKITESYRFS